MNIRHECPLPDLSFAVTAPLQIQKANGADIVAQRWTLSGVWLDSDEDRADAAGDINLTIPFQGVFVTLPAKLAATDDPSYFAWHELNVRQRETLAAFHKGVLSGQMVTTGDIITSLDTPVDLVPMGETEEEEAAGKAKEKPRLFRVIYNTLKYIIFAVLLFSMLGNQIWSRLTRINLDHARFSAPIETYNAPEAGYVERLYVRVGDTVKAGDKLVKIEDPDRESDVEETRAEVRLAERRLREAEAQLAEHEALYPLLRARLWGEFYRLWKPWSPNAPRSTVYPPDLQTAWEILYAFDRGRDLGYVTYFETLEILRALVRDRDLDWRRWKRELRHKKAAADEMIVRAKRAGTVQVVDTMRNNYVGRDDLLVEVEDNSPRVAVGWLDDSMATRVYVGMPADITYMHRGASKRNAGIVTDIQAGTDISQPDKYGMIITITADKVGVLNARKWFRRNAPARIELKRFDGFDWPWTGEEDDGSS
ncbi:MAG: biotin/lipoyl-binding protein [Rhodobacteraceae bacterium]|nr:biotin/lipoyl-binding protein [Paracoccaceae bacterium]